MAKYSLCGVYAGAAKLILDHISGLNGEVPPYVKDKYLACAGLFIKKAGKGKRAREIGEAINSLKKSLDSKVSD